MGLAASKQEAFWEACGFGHVQRVEKFLEDPNIDVNWVSYTHDCCPIHVASQGKPEIVRMLIDAKCDVNVKDIRGNLPIHHAAMKGHSDIMQTLIDHGSEINTQDKNGWTALHCAAYWNYPAAVRVLVKNNADVHLQNKDERTALHETARSPEQNDQKLGEISRLLIEAGCDINAKSSDLGEADFTGLMFASYHNHPEVSSAFIEAGCDINAQGTNLWTALHWAADRGNDEMVYLLLESGADPTIKGLREELAADRAQNPEIKDVLMNAVNMWEEMLEFRVIDTSSDKNGQSNSSKIEKSTVSSNVEEEKLNTQKFTKNNKQVEDKQNMQNLSEDDKLTEEELNTENLSKYEKFTEEKLNTQNLSKNDKLTDCIETKTSESLSEASEVNVKQESHVFKTDKKEIHTVCLDENEINNENIVEKISDLDIETEQTELKNSKDEKIC